MYFYTDKYISRFSCANYYVNFCSRKHKFAGIASNAALVSAIQQSFANQTQAIQAVAVRIEPQGKVFLFPFQYLSAPVKEQGIRRFVFIHLTPRHRFSKQLQSRYNRVRRFFFVHLIPRQRFKQLSFE